MSELNTTTALTTAILSSAVGFGLAFYIAAKINKDMLSKSQKVWVYVAMLSLGTGLSGVLNELIGFPLQGLNVRGVIVVQYLFGNILVLPAIFLGIAYFLRRRVRNLTIKSKELLSQVTLPDAQINQSDGSNKFVNATKEKGANPNIPISKTLVFKIFLITTASLLLAFIVKFGSQLISLDQSQSNSTKENLSNLKSTLCENNEDKSTKIVCLLIHDFQAKKTTMQNTKQRLTEEISRCVYYFDSVDARFIVPKPWQYYDKSLTKLVSSLPGKQTEYGEQMLLLGSAIKRKKENEVVLIQRLLSEITFEVIADSNISSDVISKYSTIHDLGNKCLDRRRELLRLYATPEVIVNFSLEEKIFIFDRFIATDEAYANANKVTRQTIKNMYGLSN